MAVSSTALYFAISWGLRSFAKGTGELHTAHERRLEAEHQATPALLASSIAHDVANLLTIIRVNLERVKREAGLPTPVGEAVAKIDKGTDRLTDLVKRLRGAKSSLFSEEPTQFDFNKAVNETISLMRTHVCCEKTRIEFNGDPETNLRGYVTVVHQLVMNLIINAAEATNQTSNEPRVDFAVRRQAGGVELIVEDNGPGISPSLREKVLSPFFTTKATGTGLGLTSVNSCVEIYRGSLAIDESPTLGGARFTIMLPDLSDERVRELRNPDVSAGVQAGVGSIIKGTEKRFLTTTSPSRPLIPSERN